MSRSYPHSRKLYENARQTMPGGVNSPVRAFRGVGGTPIFMRTGAGARIHDADGHSYIDYVNSWGAMILGHAHPDIVAAVQRQAALSLGFGAPTDLEVELAEWICSRIPSLDQVRLVNSGTEATMSAIRLARGFTGRDLVAKFAGCYHGHADSLLVKAGSGALTLGAPDSAGVPAGSARDTLVLPFNEIDAVAAAFDRYGKHLAAVIVEPVAGNMSCIPPEPGFLEALRDLCNKSGCLLIFDEVMTGFRVHPHGAQGLYDIIPDLTTLGKIIGGGLPVGAYGGRREIMSHVSPLGTVYQAGTLSGNPVAVAAGLAALRVLEEPGFHVRLAQLTQRLVNGFRQASARHGVPLAVNHVCGMFGLFFCEAERVISYAQVMACDTARFRRFFHLMLDSGVYLAPSAFEAGFVSAAHDEAIINETLEVADDCFRCLAREQEGTPR